MCGIAGFYYRNSSSTVSAGLDIVQRMCDQIRHRGPDGEGQIELGPATFGHRRLAVIDLHERSLQPMLSVDRDTMLVFNGEVYNFQALRKELEANGCVFRTLSDTEVLLHGWHVWGRELPTKLRGMFAFVIWDSAQQTIFMARDRYGKKPIFYYMNEDLLIFSSEIKSILQYPEFKREVDNQSIHDYLFYGYCVGEHTAFKGIKRLLPAHTLYMKRGKEPQIRQYWKQAPIDSSLGSMSVEDASHELVERFDEGVKLRMIANVPIGAFLSGGVDSSAVVARMASLSTDQVKTFSVGFDTDGYDETAYARQVANRYDTEHHAFTMNHDIIEELPEIVWHYGEPYSDSSALATYALSREVRRHVTVGITGDGSDEVLLGYSRYFKFLDIVKSLDKNNADTYLKHKVGLDNESPLLRDMYSRSIAKFRNEHQIRGYGESLIKYLFNPSSDRLGTRLEEATIADAVDRVARVDCNVYLSDDLLVKADIATMAHGLEGRSPFLDHVFTDWCTSLPQHVRIFKRNGVLESKALLKQAMEPYVPHDCMYRRKMGFSVPVRHWMKHDLREFITESLLSKKFIDRGFVTREYVENMLHGHMNDTEDHGTRLWALLCLEIWCQTFIDATGDKPLNLNVVSNPTSFIETAK